MGREITHAIPPKFPDSSQRTGFASHLRPSINARSTPHAYCHPLLMHSCTIESLPASLHAVPPGPYSKVSSVRFSASPGSLLQI